MSQARKLKTQLGQDVRRWHAVRDFAALSEFVKASYGAALPQSYVLHYRDEEQDLVTVASDADLDAAFQLAEGEGRMLKIFVTPVEGGKQQGGAVEEEEEPAAPRGFFEMVREEPEFRAQFVAFVQAFLTAARAGEAGTLQSAFAEALAGFPEIARHPDVVRANAMFLPMALAAAEPYAVFLTAIDPARVGAVVDKMVALIPAGGGPCGPMFMPPPFIMHKMMRHLVGGHGPRWRHRRGRRSRGPWGCRGRRHPQGGCRGRRGWCGAPQQQEQEESPFRAELVKSGWSLSDGTEVMPQQGVIKTWTVKNTGAESWPEGTRIVYTGEPRNPLVDGDSFPVPPVLAGEQAELAVVLASPPRGGDYACQWRLVDSAGRPFGPVLTATLAVADPPPMRVLCPCGKPLLAQPAGSVYGPRVRVECDGCGATMGGDALAYHCAGGRSGEHPDGWDLCEACARQRVAADEQPRAEEPEAEEKPDVQEEEDAHKSEEADEAPEEPQADALRTCREELQAWRDQLQARIRPSEEAQAQEAQPAPQPEPQPEDALRICREELQIWREQLQAREEAQAQEAQPEPQPEPQEEAQFPDWATMTADREVLKQFYEEYLAAMRAEDEAQQQQPQEEDQDPEVEPAVEAEPEPEPEPEPYKFAAQLARLQELNFGLEEDALKALLEQHGGRVDVVVHAMLGL